MRDRWQRELEQHRQARREEIIAAARELFLERDLPGVTMTDLEERTGISRVTLYKYFKSIHEIAFEVQMRVMKELCEPAPGEVIEGRTGLERLRNWLLRRVRASLANPNLVRFTALFDHYYRSAYPDPKLQEEYRRFLQSMVTLRRLVEEGVRDGSIRSDLDTETLTHLLGHAQMGMLQRLIVRGHIIRDESGVDPEVLLTWHVDMLVQYAAQPAGGAQDPPAEG